MLAGANFPRVSITLSDITALSARAEPWRCESPLGVASTLAACVRYHFESKKPASYTHLDVKGRRKESRSCSDDEIWLFEV